MFVLFGPVCKTKGVLNRVLVGRNWLKYTDKVGSKTVVVVVNRWYDRAERATHWQLALWTFGRPYKTPGDDPLGKILWNVASSIIFPLLSLRRYADRLSSLDLVGFCLKLLEFVVIRNQLLHFVEVNKSLNYDNAGTTPFPLSGFVMMMLSSQRKSDRAFHSSLLRMFFYFEKSYE